MTPISFRICLTIITLLHADFAIGSDLQDHDNTIKSEGEYSENDSRQRHFSKKSLVIFITDLPSELSEENYKEDKKLLLRSQDLSGDLLQKPANHSTIKKNGSEYATNGTQSLSVSLKHKHKHASEERMRLREQQAIEKGQRDHERRVREIVDFVSKNYQSCVYLAYEAQRIRNSHVVMDIFRKMAEDVDNPKYPGLKAKALECGKPIYESRPFVWHKPNKVIIHTVKDSVNDGVY